MPDERESYETEGKPVAKAAPAPKDEYKEEKKPVAKVAAVEVYRDSKGEWRWKAKSANGKVVADSAEGYRNRPWARKMAVDLYPDAKVVWGPGK
jgi:uncharacterized protein YegP (UPF0339 family)